MNIKNRRYIFRDKPWGRENGVISYQKSGNLIYFFQWPRSTLTPQIIFEYDFFQESDSSWVSLDIKTTELWCFLTNLMVMKTTRDSSFQVSEIVKKRNHLIFKTGTALKMLLIYQWLEAQLMSRLLN